MGVSWDKYLLRLMLNPHSVCFFECFFFFFFFLGGGGVLCPGKTCTGNKFEMSQLPVF